MILGRIAGRIVSTIRHPEMDGHKLLVVDRLDARGKTTGDYLIALDAVGALSRYETFPLPLRRRDVWHTSPVGAAATSFYKDNLRLARRAGRRDRVLDLKWARSRSRMAAFLRARVLGRRRSWH